jgi:hypothetical protein
MTRRLALSAMVALAAACGGDERARNEEASRQIGQGADKVQQGAETMSEGAKKGSAEMAEGLQQMAKGLQQMAQTAATPVPFETLMALLPEIPGWTRAEPSGETLTVPMAYSTAQARYAMGDSRLTLEIKDTALSQILLAPLSMFLTSGYAERSTDGFKQATTIGRHPGFEEWNAPSRRAEVTAVVAGRFIVKATAEDVAGIEPARRAVEAVDLTKLAALK